MHDAYTLKQILKLPLQIECLTSFHEHLVVGTKQGHLLMYTIKFNGAPEPQVQLFRSNKYFSKKPITQVHCIPEHSILIALTNSTISVHDIDPAVTNFPVITTLKEAAGATLFSLDIVRQKSLTGEQSCVVRMAVAVRRKIQFYYWKNRKFMSLRGDITVPDIPKSLAWCKNTVCIGFRGEYSLVKLGGTQEMCELFPTGKNQEAKVRLLQDERFALAKDEQTTFIDLEGNMKLTAISWSEVPQDLCQDMPYIIAAVSKGIEVKTDEPRLSIQTLEVPKPKFVCTSSHGLVYVASVSHVWCLQLVSVSAQIPQLLRDKQFELAITLSNICDENLDDKTKRIQEIKTLYAFDLFCTQKFKESLNVFLQLDIDPSHVIGLYHDLLPQEFRNHLSYPDKVPRLQGRELENALLSLIEFLTKVKHNLRAHPNEKLTVNPMVEGSMLIKSKKQMLQIVDTTLLKCYLKTIDALVAPLLRLPDNNCHLEETERALKKAQKYPELIIFYNTRGLHHKALDLLHKHADRQDSPLKGHEETVRYLQNLGAEHIEIIFKYAAWVLEANEDDGLSIFTEDLIEVEGLPRPRVLDFLTKTKRSSVIRYLEHVILVWDEKDPAFHNALILQYMNQLQEMDRDSEEFNPCRKKLRELLQSSKHYTTEVILSQCPNDFLFEERALLLGAMGKHQEALIIYLYRLKQFQVALDYCKNHYQPPDGTVYTTLVCLLANPSQYELSEEPNYDATIQILNEHGSKIDLLTVLKILPSNIPLKALESYIISGLEMRVTHRRNVQLHRGLMHAEHLQVQNERIAIESVQIRLSEFDVCPVCHKRFGNQAAFVRLPNGQVVHYSCRDGATTH